MFKEVQVKDLDVMLVEDQYPDMVDSAEQS